MNAKNTQSKSPVDLFDFFMNMCAEHGNNEEECTTDKSPDVQYNLTYFIQKIADKRGWRFEKANGWLGSIEEMCPAAALSIILREIAVELDKKYDDHIEKSEKIYVISLLDGRIHEIIKAHVKNYRNFAAFRTIEDAKIACNILREKLKRMYAKRE